MGQLANWSSNHGSIPWGIGSDQGRESTDHHEKAGNELRLYWVVAVDPLAQVGIPSSPTWHYRTQRKYYEPFVGEWHQ